MFFGIFATHLVYLGELSQIKYTAVKNKSLHYRWFIFAFLIKYLVLLQNRPQNRYTCWCWFSDILLSEFTISKNAYRKVASRSTSRLVARPGIFRLFMKGKFDPYVLWPLAFGLWPLNSRPVYCSRLYGMYLLTTLDKNLVEELFWMNKNESEKNPLDKQTVNTIR